MLRECPVSRYEYDVATDTVRLHTQASPGTEGTRTASLLLAKAGHLVGVDLRQGPSGMGDLIMWGPHEDVARTESASVRITLDTSGEICRVDIPKAKQALKTPERTPYRG